MIGERVHGSRSLRRFETKQRSTWLFLVLATFVLLLMSCTGDAQQVDTPTTEAGVSSRVDDNNRYIATIITNLGSIKIELFGKEVPNTVNNFVNLSKAGFLRRCDIPQSHPELHDPRW